MLNRNWKLFGLILLTVAALLVTSCRAGPAPTGILEGTVTIGPLLPVQPPTPPPTPCEVYQARKIMIYNANHTELIKTVDIDCSGHYRVELEVGIYTVDINRIGIDHSREVPRQVEIRHGETFKLDIDIDTGIR